MLHRHLAPEAGPVENGSFLPFDAHKAPREGDLRYKTAVVDRSHQGPGRGTHLAWASTRHLGAPDHGQRGKGRAQPAGVYR